jgi:UDP-glucose 4-epimerase
MLLLVTGATGKVGRNLVDTLLSEPRWREACVRALCHNRALTETERIEVVKGTIAIAAASTARCRASRMSCTWQPARRSQKPSWT